MKVLVKSLKNATEQNDYGNKPNENAGINLFIKLENTYNSWKLNYLIHYNSLFAMNTSINEVLVKKRHQFG